MSTFGNVSPKSKALIIVNEYQQRTMDLDQLKSLFQQSCPTLAERHAVANEIEEALRQAKFPPPEIWKLLDGIFPERLSAAGPASVPATPPDARKTAQPTPVPGRTVGKKTQPVKSPFMKSFDDFEFGQQPATLQSPAGSKGGVTLAGAPPSPGRPAKAVPPMPATGKTPRPAPPPPNLTSENLPSPKDIDKTAMFGATLKGISLSAVRPKTKARVLIADDDQRIRFVYRTKLEESGYTVIEAENGMEAWRLIQTGEADIAILDMKMPGYHGLDVLGRMSDAGMSIPVIISTAYDQLADEFVVATYPKLKYLVKPIDPAQLLATVDKFAAGLIGPG
jgi:CheY-like chemotaxis protein